ncbi:ATP-binding protein [Streptomyces sp. MST-110588]|uniref:ATP-binding protein n=1 Tax=Streptomyces sp. MST-110588 TaxID=2833628 RepID=UPI001F5C3090|nr:ATP-binding protein [Streptomyces sp. MST-110588]UNO43092.1 ATP-binding protein [Streptomyces sp. MST-110588]
MGDRLGDRLATAREQGFVGRRRESADFSALLAAGRGAVVYVYGPGGIGKTALLHHFAQLAGRAGRPPVHLHASELRPDEPEMTARIPDRPDPVLLIDGLDGAPGATDALRTFHRELLAHLPGRALVALAGRVAPPLSWRLDPAWRGLLHPVPVGPLDEADSRELLARRGVPEHARDAGLAFTRGHPLALALVADVTAHGGEPVPPDRSPQIVQALLAGLLEAVPTPLHRAALESCAQVLETTEPLLAALLETGDARPYFDWLRALSAMECGPRGIHPHDLVRDVLDAELRWRHPERRALLHRRAGAYYQRLFTEDDDRARQRAVLADFAYLHRDSPVVGPLLDPVTRGAAGAAHLDRLSVSPLPVSGGELIQACAIAAIHEGSAAARLVQDWSVLPQARTHTVRGPDGVAAGFYTLIELTGTEPPGAPADPAVRTACDWLARHGELREGETALLVRFWMSRDEYQAVSPVQTLITLRLTHHYLTGHRPALTLLPFADPEFWEAGCAYVDFARLPAADFTSGGRRFGMFVHDWRRVPGPAWLTMLIERERAQDPLAVPPPPAPEPLRVLDREAFAHAVREALRGLARADGLRDSPLLGTRLVTARCARRAGPRERATALREAVRAAAAALEASPQDRRGFRALHHTYLRPAGTQARAAELLRLPMTTYRRHLAAGIGRLTELLWQEELDAPGEGAPGNSEGAPGSGGGSGAGGGGGSGGGSGAGGGGPSD